MGIFDQIGAFFTNLGNEFYFVFIQENRYMRLVEGLGNTLLISVCAALIGLVLGFVVAMFRISAEHKGRKTILSRIAGIYIDVVRGTPFMVQLLVWVFVIFAQAHMLSRMFVVILACGFNSGAYVAEIIRGGIVSIDKGQMEAGRSLGLGYLATMRHIIIPQAIKNVLPALGNELIVLIKETAVVGTFAVMDLTKAANVIVSRVYTAFMPYIGIAIIYYIIIKLLSKGLSVMERRLRASDQR